MTALRNLAIALLKLTGAETSPPTAATTPGTLPVYWPYSDSARHNPKRTPPDYAGALGWLGAFPGGRPGSAAAR
jgi:hypothetical protein